MKDINRADVYFSADVETDGPIPGPYSMLSFALVYAGRYDGSRYERPSGPRTCFYREIKPISEEFQPEALRINGLDRMRLCVEGQSPVSALLEASEWIAQICGSDVPVLVAYPLSFDWTWLYWYFVRYCETGSPFGHSRCFDMKTALSVKTGVPICRAGRASLPHGLQTNSPHTHHALDDAIEQAEIFANLFDLACIEATK